jgi:hypothetical protein
VPEAPFPLPPLVSAELPPHGECTGLTEDDALAGANQALDRYNQRCPSGAWSSAVWRVRIRGLCLSQRFSEAQSLMYWFWSEHEAEAAEATSYLRDDCPRAVLASPSVE